MSQLKFLLPLIVAAALTVSCSTVPNSSDNSGNSSSKAPSSGNSITSFYLTSDLDSTLFSNTTVIISNTNITLYLPYWAVVSNLVAHFTTTGSSVKIGSNAQISGTTTNDFSSPLTYTVTAEDGTAKDYTITVFATADPYDLSPADIGPAGGYIFYTNANWATDHWKYMEAAAGDVGTAQWSAPAYEASGATYTAIGSGKTNTQLILNGSYSAAIAQKCLNYSATNNGIVYEDWFLPSKDELYQVYLNLYSITNVGGFSTGSYVMYWSSSESGTQNAWCLVFDSGSQESWVKGNSGYIRPVRKF